MDEVDPLGGDDALKAAHVDRHDERVLGRRWKLDKEAANRVQFARQLAGVARDQRSCARLRQRRGDGQRRPFVAAGVAAETICRIVRPASGALAPRPNGVSVSTLMGRRPVLKRSG